VSWHSMSPPFLPQSSPVLSLQGTGMPGILGL
jgi:hypothetical protein